MKKVLWVSRHKMSPAQEEDLKRIYGEVEVTQYTSTVKSAAEVAGIGKDCDIFAVVLPPNLLADLVNPRMNEKPVIRAKSNRIETGKFVLNNGKEEKEFIFEHAGWEQVLKIDIVVKAL